MQNDNTPLEFEGGSKALGAAPLRTPRRNRPRGGERGSRRGGNSYLPPLEFLYDTRPIVWPDMGVAAAAIGVILILELEKAVHIGLFGSGRGPASESVIARTAIVVVCRRQGDLIEDTACGAGGERSSQEHQGAPIFFALSGTLVGRWFRGFDEAASIAANFVISAGILIPATLGDGRLAGPFWKREQFCLVTMFFLFVPGLSSLISLVLSSWISDLHFTAGSMFLVGLALIAAPLFVFSMKSRNVE